MTLQHSEGNSFIGACAVHSVYLFLTDRKKACRKILIISDFSRISNFFVEFIIFLIKMATNDPDA